MGFGNAEEWAFDHSRLRNILNYLNRKDKNFKYAGREIMAATAVGFAKKKNIEKLKNLLKDAFKILIYKINESINI